MAVKLSPPELAHVPERFRAPDGTSQFAPAGSWQYTTAALLEAEARLLEAGKDTSGPAVSYGTVTQVCERPLPGRAYKMGQDQAVAVELVAASGRACDVLVGPAGTGKTVALSGLLAAWEAEHGPGSVKGLAPFGLGRGQPGRGARHTDREHRQVALRSRPGGRAAGGGRPAACPGRPAPGGGIAGR